MVEPREIAERYRLEKILKSSRAGSVLRAIDLATGEVVVVKLLTPGSSPQAGLERFLRLAAGLAGLGHPSFPTVRDFGLSTDGSPFLVTEHVEGQGFETLAGGPPRRLISLLAGVVEGLKALAARDLSHGNLSPDNLLVVEDGTGGLGRLKVIGLGSASFRSPGTGGVPDPAVSGSPNARFRAPEELTETGEPVEGWRSDLYSLALVICQALKANVTFADSPEPRLAFAKGLGFTLTDAEALRLLLEGALRRRAADRPSLERAKSALWHSVGGEPEPAPVSPVAPVIAAAQPLPVAPPAPAAPAADLLEQTRPAFFPEETPPPAPATAQPVPAPAPAAVSPAPAAAPPPPAAAMAPPPAPLAPPVPIPPPAEPGPAEDLFALPDVEEMLRVAPVEERRPEPPAARARIPITSPAATPFDPDDSVGVAPPVVAPPPPPPVATGYRRFLRPVPLAAAGAVLVLISLGVLWLAQDRSGSGGAAAQGAAVAAPAPPREPATVRLAAARDALAQGDDQTAFATLRSITAAEQSTLPPASCALLACLEEILAVTAPERLAHSLATGFDTGSLALLRLAVRTADEQPWSVDGLTSGSASGSAAGKGAVPRADLDRARRAVDLYRGAEDAARRNDPAAALASFAAVLAVVPHASDADGLRERAAAAIETTAEGQIGQALYDEALATIQPLTRTWADRPGLAKRIETYRAQQKAEKDVAAALVTAANTERRKKPDEGLEALHSVKPTPHLQADYTAAEQRLAALLAQVDQAPPVIELRDGYLLDYDRGTVANVSVRVRDDYRVQSVKIFARPEGGRMAEIPFEKSGFAYSVAIPPGMHHNGTVDFYVVATDLSGHQATLGTRDRPLQLKRKRGFRE